MYTLYQGDCLDVMPTLEAGNVDAIICDPPSGIGFMGAEWDKDKGGRDTWIAWLAEVLTHARRVLKPGGYALIWALPRTSHWTATAIEDAGLVIQDRVSDLLSGDELFQLFVDSLDDNQRQQLDRWLCSFDAPRLAHIFGQGFPKNKTHLKPAVEDWYLAYKPGGKRWLNIEGCRVATDEDLITRHTALSHFGSSSGKKEYVTGSDQGRYPPHLILSHAPDCTAAACGAGCPVRLIGEQSGVSVSSDHVRHNNGCPRSAAKGTEYPHLTSGIGDTGTAARFFPQFPAATGEYAPIRYEGKASRADREWGTEGLEVREVQTGLGGGDMPIDDEGEERNRFRKTARNHHPTVKSTELMQWLVRLVTHPHDVVLDMFMGSGTTGIAAIREARRFIGVEKDPAYFAIAEKRISTAANNRQMTLEELL